tara:strand:+ start:174 stop:350 length:177 start_codon:yes stop_codon:yes gene_type:complete
MRKRDERFNWMSMTPAEQLHVIKLCRQRYRRKIMKQNNLVGQPIEEEGSTSPQRDLFG